MKLPSASKLSLARACAFPWSPHAPRWPAFDSSAAGDHGTAVHGFAESISLGNQHHDVSPEVAVYASAINQALDDMRTRFEPTSVNAEVPIAFDCETGAARRLPKGEHRDYRDVRSTEIAGTMDLLIAHKNGAAVWDWKTGRGARDTATRDSWQMLFLGLVVGRIYKLDAMEIAQVHIEPGDYYIDSYTLDSFDLDNIEEEIRSVYREIRGGQQTPKPGPHCYGQWCSIRGSCPATTATLERVSAEAHRHLPLVADIANDEQAARVRVGLKLVEEQAKAWKSKLEEYVRTRGAVPMGDGKWYGVVLNERESVDASTPEARKAIEETVGPEALEWSASKASIERAAAARATKRGDKTALTRATMDRLREIGATKVSQFERLEEFKKKDEDAA